VEQVVKEGQVRKMTEAIHLHQVQAEQEAQRYLPQQRVARMVSQVVMMTEEMEEQVRQVSM
jgi:hypothetical protein